MHRLFPAFLFSFVLASLFFFVTDEADAKGSADLKGTKVELVSEVQDKPSLLTNKPVPGMLSSRFGMRPDPVKSRRQKRRKRRRQHKGIDFVATRHTLVHAAGAGVVIRAGRSGGYGRMVVIDHGGGLHTRYAHLQRINVKRGEFVPAGGGLGTVGSSGRTTGPHLHFETRQDGVALPPQDVVEFELPPCSKHARHCKEPRKRKQQPNT